MDNDAEIQEAEDERRIDGDRLIRIPRWVLDDVLGIVRLSEVSAVDRKIASKVSEEIERRISHDVHPANGGPS